ncbi:hypothetical protein SpiGrapes_2486 [Sphaerochaeta pleomorpha str. Grapes]|uniref:Uncharacterized protein n=1 Tax=Sphaerochaeta pleomorpha (strain ATCC BAA-1885 / DSM 22778 / Grapes) TaxID=158190 RepID=G8QU00_SPHPG|nr:hypothetical protein [Sphaerochaeta pleomorpha]AEV30247.1 hypothetical protein SpiGrapes_2486 [Sphaerochaeta pleomorpha str. Grapes]
MRRNLVILLLIISSLSVLGVTYWLFRPGKAEVETATVQSAEPLRQEPQVAKEKAITQPVAIKEIPETKQEVTEAEPVVSLQEPIAISTMLEEPVPLASVPEIEEMPRPEDPILANLLKVRDGKTLATAAPLTMPSSALGIRGQLITADIPEKTILPETSEEVLQNKNSETPMVAEVTVEPLVAGNPQNPKVAVTEAVQPAPDADIPEIAKENSPEMVLSISFFDKQLDPFSNGIKASLDLTGTVDSFVWGGSLELGMIYETPNRIYASLLGKAIWTLGKGNVTFPLSIALGPTLFYDQNSSFTWGITAEAMAGIRYMLTDSFSLFASTGITYQLEIPSFENHWVIQPLQLGVGFRF